MLKSVSALKSVNNSDCLNMTDLRGRINSWKEIKPQRKTEKIL